jgi:hypothetical protein
MGPLCRRGDLTELRGRRRALSGGAARLAVLVTTALAVLMLPAAAALAGDTAAARNVLPPQLRQAEPGAPLPLAAASLQGGRAGSSTIFYDGSEGATSPWTVEGDPTWAIVTYRSAAGGHSSYCAGSGTAPPGPYFNSMSAWRIAGPFDLSAVTSATFQFQTWYDTELDHDYLRSLVSLDGENFYGWQQSGKSGNWTTVSRDLTAVPTLGNVCGKSGVYIAFRFVSDASVTAEGAYVDEVSIKGSSGGGGGSGEAGMVLTADAETVPYNGSVGLVAALLDANTGFLIPNKQVDVYATQENSLTADIVFLESLTSSSGDYETRWGGIQKRTYFVMMFPGDAQYGETWSNLVKVMARAKITPPAVPSSVRANVPITSWGSIKPRHSASQNKSSHTRVYVEHYLGGRWQAVISLYASKYKSTSTETRYGYTLRYKPGTWRVRAVHQDDDHAKSTSSWRTFTVR